MKPASFLTITSGFLLRASTKSRFKDSFSLGELNEKIKRKAHVKQSFSLDFLERGTFTEYP